MIPLWRRPLPWGITSLVINPLLAVSAYAVLCGWVAIRARRRAGEGADEEWLGVGLAVAGVVVGVLAHLALGGLGYGFYVLIEQQRLERGPVALAGYEYRAARAAHTTRLDRHGPAPDPAQATPPPEYVTAVTVPGRDGPLEAWLMLPEGDGVVPGVVYLHSGFALADSDAASAWNFVTAGYAVLLPTCRGENGNAGDFELLLGEVDDAAAAVRTLAAHPRVLDERIYVFGQAVGGALAALLALEPGVPIRLTGSSGGLYAPSIFRAWKPGGYVPFSPTAARERDLRSPIRFADQFLVPHYAYVGEQDLVHADLPRLQPAIDAAPNLHVESLPGDQTTSLLPSIARFIRRAADARDFDDGRVLADLVSAEPERRQKALAALRDVHLPLTPAQTSRLLRLAIELDRATDGKDATPSAPAARPSADPRGPALLAAVVRSVGPEDLGRLEGAYSGLSAPSRSAALDVLLAPNDRETLERGLARIIAERDPEVVFPTASLLPILPELLFPALFRMGREHPWVPDLLDLVIERCDTLRAAAVASAEAEAFLLPYWERRRVDPARRAQLTPGDWLYADDYADARHELGLAIDALGCFASPSRARLRALRAATQEVDPLLRFFAVQALVRLDQNVDRETLAAVAEWDQTRAWLYALLAPRSKLTELPPEHCTQEAIARSHLVQWLAHPVELGRPPVAIETMARVSRATGEYFAFRFMPRPGSTWLVGVAGPYGTGAVSATLPDDVFSDFRPASHATAEAHVDGLIGRLTAFREDTED